MAADQKKNIVIIGGGVIGCTTAYFLAHHASFDPSLHKITLLEATSIAAAASGKAGGLLGLWAYPDCIVPLSFRLHAELAAKHNGAEKWGYRKVKCGSVSATVTQAKIDSLAPANRSPGPRRGARTSAGGEEAKEWEKLPKQDEAAAALLADADVPTDLDWLDPETIEGYSEMGDEGSTDTAQVHPFHFTNAIADLAREKGVEIRLGALVTRVKTTKTTLEGVVYKDRETGEEHTLDDVTDVVVCAGPWTGKLLPRTRIDCVRAHSVVFEADVSPYAVFTDIALPPEYVPPHRARKGQKRKHKGNVDPEMYSRPFNEVYACAEPDSLVPLPETADKVQTDEDQCADLIAYVRTVAPPLRDAPVTARQACYIPRHIRFGEQRSPLVGPALIPGLWVASGHTAWGIQNGPATGLLMAEYILEGEAKSADVAKLDPRLHKV